MPERVGGGPPAAIDALPLVGYSAASHVENGAVVEEGHWTISEVDAAAAVIGITERHRDGTKKAMPGRRRGLVLPAGWADRLGAVLVVEGASDALALTAAGLAAVGRPAGRRTPAAWSCWPPCSATCRPARPRRRRARQEGERGLARPGWGRADRRRAGPPARPRSAVDPAARRGEGRPQLADRPGPGTSPVGGPGGLNCSPGWCRRPRPIVSLAVPPPTNGPRSLCARMSRHERPEEWSDIRISDLRGWALENRGRLLGHALTVLKAHAVAGFPTHNLHPFGDYGQWSRVAREAVVTAGLPDPLLSSAGLRATGTRPSRHSRRCSATGTAWTPRTRG